MITRKLILKQQPPAPPPATPLVQSGMALNVYFYPNRPTLIPPDRSYIQKLENTGRYIAERKWNGDNVLYNTTTQEFWNRHKARHRYVPSADVKAELDRFPKGAVLNAELVNYRTKTVKDLIVVHAIMVYNDHPLIGSSWGASRNLLESFTYGDHVKLSEVFKSDFWERFQEADGNIVEGIILKEIGGKLVFSATPPKDVPWMKKVRKPRAGVYSY